MPLGKFIVVSCGDFIYKQIVSTNKRAHYKQEIKKLMKVANAPAVLQHLSLPIDFDDDRGFLKYHKLIYPLSKDEARSCLEDFVHLAAAALESLHQLSYVHNDVRLENVCFKYLNHNLIAVLIDLEVISHPQVSSGYVNQGSSMGVWPTDCQDKEFGLDWKQFGLMIAFILDDREVSSNNYHNKVFKYSAMAYTFVFTLIVNGE